MYKIIGGDQRTYGPVTADEVRRWIAEGRLNGRSLVQAEGSNDWRPLSSLPEFADALKAQTILVPPPVSIAPPADAEAWKAEILARPAEVRGGDCLSRAWQLMVKHFPFLLGACAIVWAIGFCQFIPVLGLAYRILSGALFGGLYLVFLKKIRGEPVTTGEVFTGFSVGMAQLILAGFLSSILAGLAVCLCVLPCIYLLVAWVYSVPLVADKHLEFWSAMELSRRIVTRVWFQVFALILIAFLPLIFMSAFAGFKVFTTLLPTLEELMKQGPQGDVGRILKQVLSLNLASFSLSFVTRMVLLFNMPFAIAALMYAYENLFGPRTAADA